jgi:hypothetical protein
MIMKKYIKPSILSQLMEPEEMIALSKMEGKANGSDALSREVGFFEEEAAPSRKSGWGDDEE